MYNYTSIVVQDKQLFARVFIRPTSVSYSILCPVIGSFRKMASFVRCWKLSTNKLTENCRCSSLSMPILYIIYIYVLLFSNWVIGLLPLQLFWQFDYRRWTHGKIYIRLFIVPCVDWIECLAANNAETIVQMFFSSIDLFVSIRSIFFQ